jgi:hypothetical protein
MKIVFPSILKALFSMEDSDSRGKQFLQIIYAHSYSHWINLMNKIVSNRTIKQKWIPVIIMEIDIFNIEHLWMLSTQSVINSKCKKTLNKPQQFSFNNKIPKSLLTIIIRMEIRHLEIKLFQTWETFSQNVLISRFLFQRDINLLTLSHNSVIRTLSDLDKVKVAN